MPTLAEVRQKFPQYADLDDEQLVSGLHKKHYADIPLEQFQAKVGFSKSPTFSQAADIVGQTTASGPASLGEAALSLGTGAAAAVPAGLAGVVTMAYDALTGRPEAEERAGTVTNQVANALTYEPRTPGGQAVAQGVALPFQKIAEGINATSEGVADASGSPFLGAAANTGLNALMMGLGARTMPKGATGVPQAQAAADAAAAKAAGAKRVNTVLDTKIEGAKAAGYKLPPALKGAPETSGIVNKAVNEAAGPELSNTLSIENAKNTNTLGRRALGLADDAELTPASLDKMKAEAGKPFDALRETGDVKPDTQYLTDLEGATGKGSSSFPGEPSRAIQKLRKQYDPTEKGRTGKFSAVEAVDEIKTLRQKATKNIKSEHAAANDLGFAQRKVADALESQLERHAESLGKPELVADLKSARVKFAKIYSVEDALTAWGDVSPKTLSTMQKRGVPLSAELKTIADMYDAFPDVMKDRKALKPTPDYGVIAGVPRAIAEITVAPPARAVAGSGPIQAGVRPSSYAPTMTQQLMGEYGNLNPKLPNAAALGAGLSEAERRRRLAELLMNPTRR